MTGKEIVRKAIHFRRPPRIPFFQHEFPEYPDDVHDIWELDRARNGWFFHHGDLDDWGCRWSRTSENNMGQVTGHPLADWGSLDMYHPPDPMLPFYYERIGPLIDESRDRYVMVSCHFNLIERFHMLRGFEGAMLDFYLFPERSHRLLDLIVEFKRSMLTELHRRYGNAIDGIFFTDDWGSQNSPLLNVETFDTFFAPRYQTLFSDVHAFGWDVVLHSCGKINELVPRLVLAGVDALNMQQPRAYGIEALGKLAQGKVAFFATADIQTTLPGGDEASVVTEVREVVQHWGTPDGGIIAFHYGEGGAIGAPAQMSRIMFEAFASLDRVKLAR